VHPSSPLNSWERVGGGRTTFFPTSFSPLGGGGGRGAVICDFKK